MKSNNSEAAVAVEGAYLVIYYRDGDTIRPVMHQRNRQYFGMKIVEFQGGALEASDEGNPFVAACREANEELDLENLLGESWFQMMLRGYKGTEVVYATDRIEPSGDRRADAHYALVFVEIPSSAAHRLQTRFLPTLEADMIITDPSGRDMSVTCRDFFYPMVQRKFRELSL